MAKINEFDGNDYIDFTINEKQIEENEMNNILNFINKHENIYLYGNGMCGKGFKEYSQVCGFHNIVDYITSDTLDEFLINYKKGRDGIILTLKADYYPEILPYILMKVNLPDILFLKEKTKSIFTLPFSREYISNNFWLTLPVTKHCNINCASCSMYAPLCAPDFYKLKDIQKDMHKMKKIGLKLKKINITGGEPFLNPEIFDILLYLKNDFPKFKIIVYTNGFLISKFSKEQLQMLKDSKAEFQITEYGLHLAELKMVYKKFNEFDIPYVIDYIDESKKFFKKKIDFDKRVSIHEYINCQFYTFCFDLYLFNGKLYKCPMTMYSDDINMHSEKKLELTDKDSLDVDSVNEPRQIHEFWRSRLPACGYCPRVTEAFTWKRSERKIEEWT